MIGHLSRIFARHRWSLPLGALSTFSFVRLAHQLRQQRLDTFDSAVSKAVIQGRGSFDGVMRAFTELGEWRTVLPLTLGVMGYLVLRKRHKEARFIAWSAGGTAILNTGLKLLFHRARPDLSMVYMLGPAPSYSFPSGHAMCSFGVFATFVIVFRVLGLKPRATALLGTATAFALIGVAASRVYFGMHYPSDVIGGQLAGAAWVSLMTGWFYPRLLPGEATIEPPPGEPALDRLEQR